MSFDTFGPGSNIEQRFIRDHNHLKAIVDAQRLCHPDLVVVMTLGTYDLTHIGHLAYLEQAKNQAPKTLVIVGLDTDAGVRIRKGPKRPIVNEQERVAILAHSRSVDLLTFDTDHDELGHTKFSLLKLIEPDIFIASERSYSKEQIAIIESFAKKCIVLESQAETSTTAKIRTLLLSEWIDVKPFVKDLRQLIDILEQKTSEGAA